MVLDIGDPALDSDQVSLKTYTVHKRHSGFKPTHGDQKYDLTAMFFFFFFKWVGSDFFKPMKIWTFVSWQNRHT